jgi:hypothetical protein
MDPPSTWAEVTKPIVVKLEVAAAFNTDAVFNPVGANALAKVIKKMAEILDREIKRRRT